MASARRAVLRVKRRRGDGGGGAGVLVLDDAGAPAGGAGVAAAMGAVRLGGPAGGKRRRVLRKVETVETLRESRRPVEMALGRGGAGAKRARTEDGGKRQYRPVARRAVRAPGDVALMVYDVVEETDGGVSDELLAMVREYHDQTADGGGTNAAAPPAPATQDDGEFVYDVYVEEEGGEEHDDGMDGDVANVTFENGAAYLAAALDDGWEEEQDEQSLAHGGEEEDADEREEDYGDTPDASDEEGEWRRRYDDDDDDDDDDSSDDERSTSRRYY